MLRPHRLCLRSSYRWHKALVRPSDGSPRILRQGNQICPSRWDSWDKSSFHRCFLSLQHTNDHCNREDTAMMYWIRFSSWYPIEWDISDAGYCYSNGPQAELISLVAWEFIDVLPVMKSLPRNMPLTLSFANNFFARGDRWISLKSPRWIYIPA